MRQFNRAKPETAVQRLKSRTDLPPFDSAEPRKSAVKPREHSSGFIRSVNDKRLLLLAQEQQAQCMIDICISQKNARYRSISRCFSSRLQTRRVIDLSWYISRAV